MEVLGAVTGVVGIARPVLDLVVDTIKVVEERNNWPNYTEKMKNDLKTFRQLLTEIVSLSALDSGDSVSTISTDKGAITIQNVAVMRPVLETLIERCSKNVENLQELAGKKPPRRDAFMKVILHYNEASLEKKLSDCLEELEKNKKELNRALTVKTAQQAAEVLAGNNRIEQQGAEALAKLDKLLGSENGSYKETGTYSKDAEKRSKELALEKQKSHEFAENFVSTINPPNYEKTLKEVSKPSPTTCEWIRQHYKYLAWVGNPSRSLLHVVADPGRGKSVLAKHVLERLSEEMAGTATVLYYFCSDKNHNNSALPLVRALLYQLISGFSQSQLSEQLYPKLKNSELRDVKGMVPSSGAEGLGLEELMEILKVIRSATILVSSCSVYIVIDGLDEIDSEGIYQFIPLLVKMLDEPAETGIKVFLSSRPDEKVENGIANVATQLRITSEDVNQDIAKFVQDQLANIQMKIRLTKEEREEICKDIIQRSEGMFLWVRLALDLAMAPSIRTQAKLKAQLKELPSGLNELYETMVRKIEKNDRDDIELARKVLTFVTFSAKPLHLAELRIALAIDSGEDSLNKEAVIDRIQDVQAIVCGFVSIVPHNLHEREKTVDLSKISGEQEYSDEDTVQLVHLSAKEYLLKKLDSEILSIDEKHGHAELAEICLTDVLFKRELDDDDLSFYSKEEGEDHVRRTMEADPFLGYAATYWPYHYKCAQVDADDNKKLSPRALAIRLLGDSPPISQYNTWQIVRDYRRTDDSPFGAYPKDVFLLAVFLLLRDVTAHHLAKGNVRQLSLNQALVKALMNYWTISSAIRHTKIDSAPNDVVRMINLLFNNGADINYTEKKLSNGPTLLMACCDTSYVEVVRVYLDRGADVNSKDSNGITALMAAVQCGSLDLVKLLVERGAEIGARNNSGMTALRLAAERDSLPICKYLLDKGADINARCDRHYTPLHISALFKKTENFKEFLRRGADINIANRPWGDTALMGAIIAGQLPLVKLLLSKGANVRTRNNDGISAIQNAAGWGHVDILKLLVPRAEKKDMDAKDHRGFTPIHYAADRCQARAGFRHQPACIEYLVEQGANIQTHAPGLWHDTPLITAASRGHLEELQTLLDCGADINAKQLQGKNAAWTAIDWNRVNCFEHLLKRGIDVTTLNGDGNTATHHAAAAGDLECLKLLINHTKGGNIHTKNNRDFTPLHEAACRYLGKASRRDQSGCIRFLAEKGADINSAAQKFWGDTPLFTAASLGCVEELSTLLDLGVNTRAKQSQGKYATGVAIDWDRGGTLRVLLERGGYEDAVKNHALGVAARYGKPFCARVLLEHGVDTEYRYEKKTALWWAIEEARPVITKHLLEFRANTEAKSPCEHGEVTPLVRAAMRRRPVCMEALLSSGANVEAKDNRGWTALDYCASSGEIGLVKLLLSHGAKVSSQDVDTVYLASEAGHKELCELLSKRK